MDPVFLRDLARGPGYRLPRGRLSHSTSRLSCGYMLPSSVLTKRVSTYGKSHCKVVQPPGSTVHAHHRNTHVRGRELHTNGVGPDPHCSLRAAVYARLFTDLITLSSENWLKYALPCSLASFWSTLPWASPKRSATSMPLVTAAKGEKP